MSLQDCFNFGVTFFYYKEIEMFIKRIIPLFFCFILLFFFSCTNNNTSLDNDTENESTEKNNNNLEDEKSENQDESKKRTVTFKNASAFNVSVYYGTNPIRNSSVYAEIKPGKEETVDFTIAGNNKATFYFVYNIKFGDTEAIFPYYPKEDAMNHKTILIEDKGDNVVVIDPINNCLTESAFLFLENNTTSQFRVLLSSSPVKPYHKDDYMIKQNETGIFEIRNFVDEDIITFETSDLFDSDGR